MCEFNFMIICRVHNSEGSVNGLSLAEYDYCWAEWPDGGLRLLRARNTTLPYRVLELKRLTWLRVVYIGGDI